MKSINEYIAHRKSAFSAILAKAENTTLGALQSVRNIIANNAQSIGGPIIDTTLNAIETFLRDAVVIFNRKGDVAYAKYQQLYYNIGADLQNRHNSVKVINELNNDMPNNAAQIFVYLINDIYTTAGKAFKEITNAAKVQETFSPAAYLAELSAAFNGVSSQMITSNQSFSSGFRFNATFTY